MAGVSPCHPQNLAIEAQRKAVSFLRHVRSVTHGKRWNH